jgi:Kef-type K+ transport system membrane component KefB
MFWIIFIVIISLVLGAFLLGVFLKDRRYEKKSVSETMGKKMWDEIATEREMNMEKAKKFREELERAKRG